MAYNNGYFPATYNGYYNPYQQNNYQPQPQQQTNSGLIWVQGEAGAKSYMVAPNNTVMLMDSENEVFYLKSSDASGMPRPLRIFKYQEVGPQNASDVPRAASVEDGIESRYVTKNEFEAFRERVEGILNSDKKEATQNGKSTV